MNDIQSYPDENQSTFPFMGEVPIHAPGHRVGIVGATGAVGGTLLKVLRERRFPVEDLRVYASVSSRGKMIDSPFGAVMVEQLSKRRIPELDYVFFAAGPEIARNWAWKFVRRGAVVIDKSPYFRSKEYAPLIVPEVNPDAIEKHRGIISNPNCTTVPLVVALSPLHLKYKLRHVTAVTFQSVSGAGKNGIRALGREMEDNDAEPSAFSHRIAYNVIPWIGRPRDQSSGEELKMITETRRILRLPRLSMRTTCVRVPTLIGHGIAVHAEFHNRVQLDEARELLEASPGITLLDNSADAEYPTPLTSAGTDAVYIGRLRRDRGANSLAFFTVADNLRKGAATNAVQIAELLLSRYDSLQS